MTPVIPAASRELSFDIDHPDAEIVFKALSSPLRLRILKLLGKHAFTVLQVTKELNLPISTVNQHIRVLEEAGLIQTELRPASRGTEKVCIGAYQRIMFDLLHEKESLEQAVEISMPIGTYVDFAVTRPCGLASDSNFIGLQGDPEAFLEPDRIHAQLLWFATGYVEYRFPKRLPPRTALRSLYLSMEVCSEAPGHNEDWPSDLTVWINGIDIGTWTSLGDFGKTRGGLNPDWWSSQNTQYGCLKSWQVDGQGSYVDGIQISGIILKDLNIVEEPYISIRIGIKSDAEYPGGINLFGRHFGNFPQDINLRLVYDK